jgi:hypothetical protein
MTTIADSIDRVQRQRLAQHPSHALIGRRVNARVRIESLSVLAAISRDLSPMVRASGLAACRARPWSREERPRHLQRLREDSAALVRWRTAADRATAKPRNDNTHEGESDE